MEIMRAERVKAAVSAPDCPERRADEQGMAIDSAKKREGSMAEAFSGKEAVRSDDPATAAELTEKGECVKERETPKDRVRMNASLECNASVHEKVAVGEAVGQRRE
jgi:hypothetical protein